MARRAAPAGWLLLTFALATVGKPATAGPAAPSVDHHQHLLSPAGAALTNRALPPVTVPAEIAALLAERAARWNDHGRLAELYTEDSLVLSTEAPGWIRGREAGASYLGHRFAREFRITPVSYREEGAVRDLGAYYTRGEGGATWHVGYVHLGLRRGDDGRWRIATEIPTFPGPSQHRPVTADDLVAALDAAGIQRAIVLSDAYYFDAPEAAGAVPDPVAAMRAENDWTAAEVARHPGRLVAFCSFDPLAAHALAELDRCAASGSFRGLKLHLDTSDVDLLKPEAVAKVRAVFAAANRHRLPILVHMGRRGDPPYGEPHARVLVDQLLPAAPDVAVVVAHLFGGGAWSDEAMGVYAEAVAAGRNLWFEMSNAVRASAGSEEVLAAMARRIRDVGVGRVLFGSDGPDLGGLELAQIWPQVREQMPLTPAELDAIAANVAPFLREGAPATPGTP